MKSIRMLTLSSFLVAAMMGSAWAQGAAPAPAPGPGLTISTTAFDDGGMIPAKYTQGVPNFVSPALQWTHVPAGTVSFALIMHDPDAALNKTTEDVLHWLAFNIPGTASGLPEAVPADAQLSDGTVQGKNRRGAVGYLGPGAPAAGPNHHYTWELFALDTKLSLGADATRVDVLKAMDGHILGKGVLVGRFHKEK